MSLARLPYVSPHEIRHRLIEELDRALDCRRAEVHVPLRRPEVGVASQFLNRCDWGSSHRQVRTEGVAQEPTSPTALEALVEIFERARGRENEQGEVVEVYLPGPEVTDASLAHLAGLTALELLILDGTQVTDAGLAHLSGLTALKELRLDFTQVTDAGLAHLTGLTALKALDLIGTQVTDAGLAHFAGLAALETLDLAGTQVTDAGVAALRKRLPNGVRSGRDPIPPPSAASSSMRGRRAPA